MFEAADSVEKRPLARFGIRFPKFGEVLLRFDDDFHEFDGAPGLSRVRVGRLGLEEESAAAVHTGSLDGGLHRKTIVAEQKFGDAKLFFAQTRIIRDAKLCGQGGNIVTIGHRSLLLV